MALTVSVDSFAAPNTSATQSASRSAVNMERARATGAVSARGGAKKSESVRGESAVIRSRGGANVSRTAVPRSGEIGTFRRAVNIISDAGNAIVRRAIRGAGVDRAGTNVVRASTAARSATMAKNNARSAKPVVTGAATRARATAVFSDLSKLGSGYNACRDAYSTCMDQFCAGVNETYRRCYCSDAFRNLRDKEEALDAATALMASFENNNLNAVDKTAAEVSAMFSASEGEAAIKKDTSASAQLLDDIGDLLAGRKKPNQGESNSAMSALTMDFGFGDIGDIWGTTNDSVFGAINSEPDLATMEGAALYNSAHQQCIALVAEQCSDGPARNMIKSAYSVFISQDCNAYQKKLDAKSEQVKTAVRTAEKYLREARLENYRAHNSTDVNECMDKVEQAMMATTACGPNYEKCLDPTGVYINSATGEPIYTARLFKLNEVIVLDGDVGRDVLSQNPSFDSFLDQKRVYANTALDSCRSISETVWTEYKRNALIKISQAQDEKLEEVKMSCVSTMKECYDTQSGALKDFDTTTAQASGALAARASRDMCADKVIACAALYGDTDGCQIDTKTNKVTAKKGGKCGLQALLNFVDTVDDVRIAEGCQTAVQNYLKQTCTPTSGGEAYPYNCILKPLVATNVNINDLKIDDKFRADSFMQTRQNGITQNNSGGRSALPMVRARADSTDTIRINVNTSGLSAGYENLEAAQSTVRNVDMDSYDYRNVPVGYNPKDNSNMVQAVMNYAFENCGVGNNKLEERALNDIVLELQNLKRDMSDVMEPKCSEAGGMWVENGYDRSVGGLSSGDPVESFYNVVFGTSYAAAQQNRRVNTWGKCIKNDVRARCMLEDENTGGKGWATYNASTGECELKLEYYKYQCNYVHGIWAGNHCYIRKQTENSSN